MPSFYLRLMDALFPIYTVGIDPAWGSDHGSDWKTAALVQHRRDGTLLFIEIVHGDKPLPWRWRHPRLSLALEIAFVLATGWAIGKAFAVMIGWSFGL